MQEKNNDMKKLMKVLFLLAIPLFTLNAQSTDTQLLLDEYLATLPERAEIAIGLINKGAITKLGYQKKNGQIIPVENSQHVFEIGSVSKTFTAALVLQQQLAGALDINHPFVDYFPEENFNNAMDSILIRHLLTHTSGLADAPDAAAWPYILGMLFTKRQPHKFMKWKHYKKYLNNNEPEALAGTHWGYNNAAYGLLGQLLEVQTKQSWESLLQQKIFDQLGMDNSYATGDGVPQSLRVTGYDAKGKKAPYWDTPFMNPAGSIKSCTDDMITWLQTHMDTERDTLFSELSQVYEIKAGWAQCKMGNAWAHRYEQEKHQIWHGGATGAFRSLVAFDPELQTGIVLLVNFNAHHPDMKDENKKSTIRTYGFRLLESLDD